MLRVVTVNASNYMDRGSDYTNILFDMVRRNLPEGYEGAFTVFADGGEYDEGIEVRPLPVPGLTGWWNKLALFKRGVFAPGERILYIDLSTLVTGRLDDIANYRGRFAINRDYFRHRGYGSALMAWEADTLTEIWDEWEEQGRPQTSWGDQAWIERVVEDADIFQDLFPHQCASFKLLPDGPPAKAVIVNFHGRPKPHDMTGGWVARTWKKGGMTRAELDAVLNYSLDNINDNIRSAMARDLPWFDFSWEKHDGQACIVGGSPSLAAQLEQLRWRKSQGHKIFALNATHDYLIAHGITPDFHVLLDARPENVRFVQKPHAGVRYLVASQCDPGIFEALSGCDVTVFHNSTPGAVEILTGQDKRTHLLGGGTTVGMKAMLIAELQGNRAIHLYGMDSCYIAGDHHAYKQSLNDSERVIDAWFEGRDFRCSGWMVSQAQDFIEFCQRYLGIVTVAGDGLLAWIAKCGIPESAAETRARAVLERLPTGAKVAEIGVFAGDLSRLLLVRKDIFLYMVDSWTTAEGSRYAGLGDFHAKLSQEQQDGFMAKAILVTEFAADRRRVVKSASIDAAAEFADGELDFVFIDAEHSYEATRADIEAWYPKAKRLGGHDYDHPDYPAWGVKRAVDEFAAAHGLRVEQGENMTWFFSTT